MALYGCKVCGYGLAIDADPCVRCGSKDPLDVQARAERQKRLFVGAGLLVCVAGYAWFLFKLG